MSAKIKTVQTEQFSMDYVCFGTGEKTFVILPGLSVFRVGEFADSVEVAYEPFADDFSVYLFDRRNELPASYSVSQMADDTALAMKTLGLKDICLFGASQGGMIAMTIAIRYPELIRNMVLGSTSPYVRDAQLSGLKSWVDLAKDNDKAGLFLKFGEMIYAPDAYHEMQKAMLGAASIAKDEDLERFVVLAKASEGFDVTSELGQIKCPVLVLGSEDDAVLGAKASRDLFAGLEGHCKAELFMYNGYGHAAYDMAPDYKERLIRFFLQN